MSDIILKPTDWYTSNAKYPAKPGDRFILQGDRAEIEFHDLKGTAENPIIITALSRVLIKGINPGGRVVIFSNCQFVRFTGDPNNKNEYTVEITGGGQAVDFRDLSSDFEADHLNIHDVGYLAIAGKTDPTCDPKTWRGNFTLRNPRIHHCIMKNIMTGEAIYVGESHYHTTFPLTNCPSGVNIYAITCLKTLVEMQSKLVRVSVVVQLLAIRLRILV
jgi:hypothetical protein